MSNSQKSKQPTQPDPVGPQSSEQTQAAQVAEANGSPPSFDFEGHTYTLRQGQPSPKALTYIARWTVDDENLAVVLAMVEMLGSEQWDAWCGRHRSDRLMPFWLELNRVAGGDEGN